MVTIYSLLAIILWYFTPRTGGGRFIVAYLPAFSIVATAVINEVTKKGNAYLTRFVILLVIIISMISIGYRAAANAKYIPVIIGNESKAKFLSDHLNFSYGD